MADKVYAIGNKKEETVLRKKIPLFDVAKENKKELRELVRKMRALMKANNGIGLSANQIGIQKRIFVAQVPDENGRQKFYAIMNPEIKKISQAKTTSEEGCLSVPLTTIGQVERADKITLEGYNLQGKKIKIKAWGLLARVFQHEVDHLNGVLFLDKAKKIKNYDAG